jgi:hypothetical protein
MADKRGSKKASKKKSSRKKAPARKKTAVRKKAAVRKRAAAKKAAKKPPPPTAAPRTKPVLAEGLRLGGIGSEAVRRATGKGWDEWLAVLDEAGARAMEHPAIARLLDEVHKLPGWWAQMVTVGYEQARGLRAPHQTRSGWETSRSKTIDAPIDEVFAAWTDDATRARWLADHDVTIRKATPRESLRITWVDGASSVVVHLWPKTGSRTQVRLQHSKLEDAAAVQRMKEYWGDQLERLREMLES